MSEQLQLRRGTAAQVAAFTGAQGEVVVDTTNNRLVLQDGATAGGIPIAKLSEAGGGGSGGSVSLTALGIGTAADPTNPLSVVGNNVLFNQSATGASPGNIRVNLSKAASTDTASFIFQDAFSERAEIGLCGDDNFHFKVSLNGTTFIDALDINATTGIVSASIGFAGSPDPTYLRGYLAGLTLSNNSNTAFNISDGVANADDNSLLMKTFGFTKMTGSWAVGNNNGALDTGSVAASTWYHIYLIERTDTGVIDALLSLSATAPTMPANYTKKRRIGSIKTDASSHILAFTQIGDRFLWRSVPTDVPNATPPTTATLQTLSVPPGVSVDALLTAQYGGVSTTVNIALWSPLGAQPGANLGTNNISAAVGQYCITTNTASQINVISNSATGGLTITTFGWTDTRGRFN
jgi:Major tropism determinant N-terminal domain